MNRRMYNWHIAWERRERRRVQWWKPLACLLILWPVTACGASEPVIGTVVEKVYDDADTTVQNHTVCTKTCTVSIIPVYEPERWLLKVEQDSDGEIKTVQVDPFTWKDAYVGDAFQERSVTK